MTASHKESKHVLEAHVFVVRYGKDGEHHTEGACIAGSHDEALAILKQRYADFSGDVSFFSCAFAVMQPAVIERWPDYAKRIEEKGYYAFLNGIFFCKCGDHQMVTHCKQEKTRTGWTAHIYNHDHFVRPL